MTVFNVHELAEISWSAGEKRKVESQKNVFIFIVWMKCKKLLWSARVTDVVLFFCKLIKKILALWANYTLQFLTAWSIYAIKKLMHLFINIKCWLFLLCLMILSSKNARIVQANNLLISSERIFQASLILRFWRSVALNQRWS